MINEHFANQHHQMQETHANCFKAKKCNTIFFQAGIGKVRVPQNNSKEQNQIQQENLNLLKLIDIDSLNTDSYIDSLNVMFLDRHVIS